MNSYGCVKCQRRHFEDETLYAAHINDQSKHGITNEVSKPETVGTASRIYSADSLELL